MREKPGPRFDRLGLVDDGDGLTGRQGLVALKSTQYRLARPESFGGASRPSPQRHHHYRASAGTTRRQHEAGIRAGHNYRCDSNHAAYRTVPSALWRMRPVSRTNPARCDALTSINGAERRADPNTSHLCAVPAVHGTPPAQSVTRQHTYGGLPGGTTSTGARVPEGRVVGIARACWSGWTEGIAGRVASVMGYGRWG